MTPLDEAQARVARDINALPIVDVELALARGLVLAQEVSAKEAIPPFANTAMDGFAVRAADTEGLTETNVRTLPVVATVAAGAVAPRSLEAGEAMRIMTGAPIPDGADAIIMVELTAPVEDDSTTERVELRAEVPVGNHIRPAGDDLHAGTTIFGPGEVLSPAHIGVIASVGLETVKVHRRPRVGVFSTGDELTVGPAPLQPGQIRDSNRPSIVALVEEAGCEAVNLGLLRDDEAEIEGALRSALGDDAANPVDALITSGGVSMGDFDFVKQVLGRLGDMNWMQVAIKPAKPLAFGMLMGTPIFGLPGNPVSSMVSFELFARPSLLTMMGRTNIRRPTVTAIVEEAMLRPPDGKTHFARVIVEPEADGAWRAQLAGGQGSHQLTAMARANGLAVIPSGDGVQAGGRVKVMLLD